MKCDTVTIDRSVTLQADHYRIDLYFPWDDMRDIKSAEEFRGFLISKLEALLAKGG